MWMWKVDANERKQWRMRKSNNKLRAHFVCTFRITNATKSERALDKGRMDRDNIDNLIQALF